jgi:hypothetical protein
VGNVCTGVTRKRQRKRQHGASRQEWMGYTHSAGQNVGAGLNRKGMSRGLRGEEFLAG